MRLPPSIYIMITEVLEEVRRNPEHQITVYHRRDLYQALSPSIDLSGYLYEQLIASGCFVLFKKHRVYGELAILTATHVLHIWNHALPDIVSRDETIPSDFPLNILFVARQVLDGVFDPTEANKLLVNDYYYEMGAISNDVPFAAWEAVNAAYNALQMVLGVSPFEDKDDVAVTAARAYAAVDNTDVILKNQKCRGLEPIQFDLSKRLEFWEWWLTEAIPQAWELAETSSRT